ncbi:MAG: winged helix-turn-helix transcriptional regulator [Clostridiales bacterium]|nr:winged helix-turn-helix transcriptional regulator [Eubacteriales bacterium]MDH7567788.1 winged helix-turn-helix transcriptional regulator [Clostridiales bacterium]
MRNEFLVLNNIERDRDATQRDIARNTGMSLGNVNILIKRLVKKGLLKMERLNPRTIKYILTPEGMKEKAALTYNYIVESYRLINDIDSKIGLIIDSYRHNAAQEVLAFGSRDEILQILENKLRQIGVAYQYIQSLDDLLQSLNKKTCGMGAGSGFAEENGKAADKALIIVWQPAYSEMLHINAIQHVNLLDQIF